MFVITIAPPLKFCIASILILVIHMMKRKVNFRNGDLDLFFNVTVANKGKVRHHDISTPTICITYYSHINTVMKLKVKFKESIQ